jgi:LPS O-antigen subunit length determinant protein (WzzB/FepE family)
MQINSSLEEINLVEILKKLMASRKLVIYITLFFTLLATIYYFQSLIKYESTLLMEVGNNNVNGKVSKVESADIFNRGIQVSLDYTRELDINSKNQLKIKTPAGDEIIQISSTSNSIESNTITINQVAEFIIDRHKNIRQETIAQFNAGINSFNIEIDYIIKADINKYTSSSSVLNKKIKHLQELIDSLKTNNNYLTETNINKLSSSSAHLNKKISHLQKIINTQVANLNLLEEYPLLMAKRAAEYPSLDETLHGHQMTLLDYQDEQKQIENQIALLAKRANDDPLLDEIIDNHEMTLLGYQDEKAQFETKLMSLKNFLKDNKIITSVVFDNPGYFFALNQQKNALAAELEYLIEQPNTRAIGQITTVKINKSFSIIFLGFIAGLFISVFIVLFIEPFRAIKWDNDK